MKSKWLVVQCLSRKNKCVKAVNEIHSKGEKNQRKGEQKMWKDCKVEDFDGGTGDVWLLHSREIMRSLTLIVGEKF